MTWLATAIRQQRKQKARLLPAGLSVFLSD
jgi:hypothetical protein